MKKSLSIILSLAMMFTLSLPVLAAKETTVKTIDQVQEIQNPEITANDSVDNNDNYVESLEPDVSNQEMNQNELKLIGTEVTERGRIDTYRFHISGSAYLEISDFRGEYSKNSHIEIQGTCGPSYEDISIMAKDMRTGGSATVNVSKDNTASMTLWSSSTWGLFINSTGTGVTGTIIVEVSQN